ncbi:TraB/GumN family protein [uncultured Mucilaginibacter sp.]|uniref:TraB/GumN family protein n=1 Tax=uncultured Mucilaginibacter sp. TaxID=797541 RepID=UPI0025FF0E80|nr:TraB/GumN family protein [uncultured Mucilaginibacter sp.]
MKHLYLISKLFCLTTALLLSASAHAQQKGLLWQITGKNITQPTYLFGTIHLFDTTLYRLPDAVMNKLTQTKKVYFELDFSKINPAEMLPHIMIKDSTQQLDKLFDATTLDKLKDITKTSPMMQGMGPMLYKFKPLFLTTLLLNNGKAVTIDMEMQKRAVSLKDSVGGLETVAEQMQALDAVSIAKQVQMMQEFIKSYTTADELVKKLTEIYVKQDIENLLTELNNNAPIDASFNEALLVKRNITMANRIDKVLGKQSTMIAVGSGHLGGKDGLIMLLKAKGYILKNVPFVFEKVK